MNKQIVRRKKQVIILLWGFHSGEVEDPVASLGNRLPTFRRHCIPSKRMETFAEWRTIVSHKNRIGISSVDVHGRVNYFLGSDFTKLTTSRVDSSVPQTYWSFAPNLRVTLFAMNAHPTPLIDIGQVVSDITYTVFHLCSTVDAQSSVLP